MQIGAWEGLVFYLFLSKIAQFQVEIVYFVRRDMGKKQKIGK